MYLFIYLSEWADVWLFPDWQYIYSIFCSFYSSVLLLCCALLVSPLPFVVCVIFCLICDMWFVIVNGEQMAHLLEQSGYVTQPKNNTDFHYDVYKQFDIWFDSTFCFSRCECFFLSSAWAKAIDFFFYFCVCCLSLMLAMHVAFDWNKHLRSKVTEIVYFVSFLHPSNSFLDCLRCFFFFCSARSILNTRFNSLGAVVVKWRWKNH